MILETQPETNDHETSLTNIIILSQIHGSPIGVIHRKSKQFVSTLFIFFDGHVHECNGFDTEPPSLIYFKASLQMIPCLACYLENDILFEFFNQSTNKEIDCYLFKTINMESILRDNPFESCDGIKILNQLTSTISESIIQFGG